MFCPQPTNYNFQIRHETQYQKQAFLNRAESALNKMDSAFHDLERLSEVLRHEDTLGKVLLSLDHFEQNITAAEERTPWADRMFPWSSSTQQRAAMMSLHRQIRCRILDTEELVDQDRVDFSLVRAQFEVFRQHLGHKVGFERSPSGLMTIPPSLYLELRDGSSSLRAWTATLDKDGTSPDPRFANISMPNEVSLYSYHISTETPHDIEKSRAIIAAICRDPNNQHRISGVLQDVCQIRSLGRAISAIDDDMLDCPQRSWLNERVDGIRRFRHSRGITGEAVADQENRFCYN